MSLLLALTFQLTLVVGADGEAKAGKRPATQIVGTTAVLLNQRVVRIYRAGQNGMVQMLDNGGNRQAKWQPVGPGKVLKRGCVGIAAVRVGSRVVRVYRILSDGTLHILDDGGNPRASSWQAIGVGKLNQGTTVVSLAAVRISRKVVRVYRSLSNGTVEILDDGGNPRATWQRIATK